MLFKKRKDYKSDLHKLCDRVAIDLMDYYNRYEYRGLFVHYTRNYSFNHDSRGRFIGTDEVCEIHFSIKGELNDPYPKITVYWGGENFIRDILNYISSKTNGCYVVVRDDELDLNQNAKNYLIEYKVSRFKENKDISAWCKAIFSNGNPQEIYIYSYQICYTYYGKGYVNFSEHYISFNEEGYPNMDDVEMKALIEVINEYSNNYYEIFSDYDAKGDYQMRHIEKKESKRW